MDNYEKKYKEALERARSIFNEEAVPTPLTKGACEYIFPELKESEDEKIRKQIRAFIKSRGSQITQSKTDAWLAWLKKQGEKKPTAEEVLIKAGLKPYKDGNQWCILVGDNIQEGVCGFVNTIEDALYAFLKDLIASQGEQKPTDKVEPKFHEGDWLIYENGSIYYVNKVYEHTYELVIDNGDKPRIPHELIDKKARLWTIQDAKDGDVLCCESGWTCIFKALNSDISFSSYCFMDDTGWFCETGSESHTLEKAFIKAYNGNIYPATKEHRDQLEKAMADAGYTFDFERKELKKIEQKPWSEEDENRINRLIAYFEDKESFTAEDNVVYANWLKSLKDRCLPQPKQEWNEEDEKELEWIIGIFDSNSNIPHNIYERATNFLKSLRPQPKQEWSEEDAKYLNIVYSAILSAGVQGIYDYHKVTNNDVRKWLDKSLRPQKPEWSEEDKNLREATIGLLNLVQPHDAKSWGKSRYDCIDWLRNLRPKNNAYHEGFKNGFAKARGMGYKQWKPTEEQIEVLLSEVTAWTKGCPKQIVLESLYNDLKKLKG